MGENYTFTNNKPISKKINDYAYLDNEDLVELIIPEGVTHIGERAFSKCKNLKKIVLPESLVYIGASAFSECENLEEIILPKNIKKLNYRTFADCKRLKKIVIPDGIQELEWAVFYGCENLEEIILPESITKIGAQLFLNCKKLKTIILPQNLEALPDECFKDCNNLDVTLNKKITQLGNRTFENCYKLSNFPENVTVFGENCFKNCKKLTTAILNTGTTELSDGMFDGCINLNEINYQNDNPLKIGKRCFRNCKSLKSIPEFIANFNEQAFENCTSLTSIDIVDNVVPFACFRGCKNIKEILNQDRIYKLSSFAFSGCESLEKFDVIHSNTISAEAFSNCKRLTKVRLNMGIRKIESRAFYNCPSLSDINLPDTIDTIKKEAFKNCHNIKHITIPANLDFIGDGAFSYMDSLEEINVSPYNKTFITPDHKILINQMQQILVLYASGLKDKSYSLKDYNIEIDILNHELIKPITGIGVYAFAGAKNLEELTVCSCTKDIESSAFVGCENLKKLNIESISLFTCPGFNIRDRGKYYFKENSKMPIYLPFETVVFSGDVVQIFPRALKNFTNVKDIILPDEKSYSISESAFSSCTLLEQVDIPKQVKEIAKDAFPLNTELVFENSLTTKGLVELIRDNQYIGDYKLYILEDGTYYIEQDDKIITITKKYIDDVCSHSEEIRDNPILFLDFMNDLINHDLGLKLLFNGILMSNMSLENRKILFENIDKKDQFALNVLKYSGILDEKDTDTEYLLKDSNFKEFVDFIELLRKYNITDSTLYNKMFICCCKKENFEYLITKNLPLFLKVIKTSNLLEVDRNIIENSSNGLPGWDLSRYILLENTITKFIKYVQKYNIRDNYLIDKPFIAISDNPLADDFFKVFDANTKRLLKSSKITENYLSVRQNLNDLLTLLKITGALEEDPIIRQRASTFINEKIFQKILPNGNENEYRVVGDDIHRIFNFLYTRDEFDKEFADFFLENYQKLIEEERTKSGFIQRVYFNFRGISKTCTSNKGSQRKLKVTLDKCRNYLSNIKFDGVTEETKDFADLIGAWYDNNSTWLNAQKVYLESLKAPRNIFTKVIVENGTVIYDNDKEKDLREKVNPNYSFEWLPKQEYDNLILGKYCNCCAHIEGAGQGIMRASMILDTVQNLVIRNDFGEIIAKSTIFVNKEEGYAVFNNVETSLNHRAKEELEKIYNAFLRGTIAFVNTYNENNMDHPITNVSIGTNRNTILDYLTDDKHPIVDVQQALQYGEYSLNDSNYHYNGDWSSKQRLVLKR